MANYGPPIVDFSPLGNLAKTFFDARDNALDRKLKQYQLEAPGEYTKAVGAGAVPDAVPATVQSTMSLGALGQSQAKLPTFAGGGGGRPMTMPADPALAPAIKKYAAEAGLDPVDVATAMSYETAGTFDPWKAGPTTQWGQHRGLIQWGEPQAKQYGVSANTPVEQQVAAAVKYLQDRGVKPGMGLMDIYSAINAGSVGRYNASDANNGGAPGTVADKVNNQMSGHREKAMALLGVNAADVPAPGAQNAQFVVPGQGGQPAAPSMPAMLQIPAGLQAAANSPNPYVRQMATKRIETIQNAQREFAVRQWERQQAEQAPTELQKNYREAVSQGFKGSIVDYQTAIRKAGAANIQNNVGPQGINYGEPEKGLTWARNPDGTVKIDERGAPIAIPYQGGSVYREQQTQDTANAAASQSEKQTANIVSDAIDRAIAQTEGAFLPVTGSMGNSLKDVGGTAANNVRALLDTIKANSAFSVLQEMRKASPTGGALGAVSEGELALLEAARGNLEQSQTKDQFLYNLRQYKKLYNQTINGPDAAASKAAPQQIAPPSSAVEYLRKNPHLRQQFDEKYGPGSSANALGIPNG